MKNLRFSHSICTQQGFSLVEVVLALAVISIGLVAILGLFPIGLTSANTASTSILVSEIGQDIFATIRTQPFTKADLSNFYPTGGPYDLTTFSGTLTNYYTSTGLETNGPYVAYYRVTLSFEPLPPLNLTKVQAIIVWPSASLTPKNTNVFVSQIAQYDL